MCVLVILMLQDFFSYQGLWHSALLSFRADLSLFINFLFCYHFKQILGSKTIKSKGGFPQRLFLLQHFSPRLLTSISTCLKFAATLFIGSRIEFYLFATTFYFWVCAIGEWQRAHHIRRAIAHACLRTRMPPRTHVSAHTIINWDMLKRAHLKYRFDIQVFDESHS